MQPYNVVQPYKKYFQKSKSFIYPALGIKRDNHISPEQTYISWGSKIRPEDKMLIVVYDLLPGPFEHFEKNILLRHPMFVDFHLLDNAKGAYTFSFHTMSEDWEHFLMGRYSKFSATLKEKIRAYFGPTSNEYVYIDSFLYPEKYYRTYSELLAVDELVLKETGELADRYDPMREDLPCVSKCVT